MKLILVRHGEAGRDAATDEQRTLTVRGQQQAVSTAQQVLARHQPDLLVSSPLVRAQQTLLTFAALCPGVPVQQLDSIKPDDDAATALLDLMGLQGGCIVVVCHMDLIARLAALLLEDWPEAFALAEARVLELPVVAAGLAVEQQRFWPRDTE